MMRLFFSAWEVKGFRFKGKKGTKQALKKSFFDVGAPLNEDSKSLI
jgi:hypothetical protein